MPNPGMVECARARLSKAAADVIAKIQIGAPFLTDAHGLPRSKHEAGDLVAIGDETYRVGYARSDTLLLERVRPTDVHRWDKAADTRQLRKAELCGDFPPRGGW